MDYETLEASCGVIERDALRAGRLGLSLDDVLRAARAHLETLKPKTRVFWHVDAKWAEGVDKGKVAYPESLYDTLEDAVAFVRWLEDGGFMDDTVTDVSIQRLLK